MLFDLTMELDWQAAGASGGGRGGDGHWGTHFDGMGREFPLRCLRLPGVVFDVRAAGQGETGVGDVDLARVRPGCFALFYSGFADAEPYGTVRYRKEHPQLSDALLGALLDRGAALIGLDFAGARRGAEHTPADERCAQRGAFIVENLCGLGALPQEPFAVYTFPVRWRGITGLPCRVVAQTERTT
ncbi:MAG: cyclase family protein [Oscillospiraceae bacterium]|nr:cyclase family protein [Oscillospiraceae bacterium]